MGRLDVRRFRCPARDCPPSHSQTHCRWWTGRRARGPAPAARPPSPAMCTCMRPRAALLVPWSPPACAACRPGRCSDEGKQSALPLCRTRVPGEEADRLRECAGRYRAAGRPEAHRKRAAARRRALHRYDLARGGFATRRHHLGPVNKNLDLPYGAGVACHTTIRTARCSASPAPCRE